MRRTSRQALPPLLFGAAVVALIAISLFPIYKRLQTDHANAQALAAVERQLERHGDRTMSLSSPTSCDERDMVRLASLPRPLASWGDIGGCGAGGGAGGGIGGCGKWIGRGVTGGLVDLQTQLCPSLAKGNSFNTFTTRMGTSALFQKWNFGVNVPLLFKIGNVSVPTGTLGVFNDESALMVGFGDLSLEITRKLGITNAQSITLTLAFPTGAYDAIREGVFLPSHLQLGSGVLGITGQYEYTVDRDWGLMIFGGNASYNGWENGAGGFRGPTIGAYSHLGYIFGPFVASGGLTLLGKFQHDRQHDPSAGIDEQVSLPRIDDNDPLFMVTPNLGLEWSMDTLAILVTAASTFSYNGYEGVSFSLGFQTSLF
ncbi:MAG: hypothetical protein KAI47_17375 [Deltaproteobacteria bacterium]|nr:hypothetical protein [Deltaproteobacteria bacterium]